MNAATVTAAWKKQTGIEKGGSTMIARTHSWASGWKPCRRAMCLDLTHPEDTVFKGQTLERFRDGDAYERSAVAHLMRAGEVSDPTFEVECQQEHVEVRDRKGRVVITGKIDGKLAFRGKRDRVPFDVKSGTSVQNATSLEALDRGRWTQAIIPQLSVYLLALGVDLGMLVLNRPGWPLLLDVPLDDKRLEVAEDFIQRATLAVAVKHDEERLPDFHSDTSVCMTCDHRGKSCAPPIDGGEGLKYIEDPALEAAAKTFVDLGEDARAFGRAKKKLQAAFRDRPLVSISGRYTVTGSAGQTTKHDIPEEIKAQYAAKVPTWTVNVERSSVVARPTLEEQLSASIKVGAKKGA